MITLSLIILNQSTAGGRAWPMVGSDGTSSTSYYPNQGLDPTSGDSRTQVGDSEFPRDKVLSLILESPFLHSTQMTCLDSSMGVNDESMIRQAA